MGANDPALTAVASFLVAIFLPLSTVWAQFRRKTNTVFLEDNGAAFSNSARTSLTCVEKGPGHGQGPGKDQDEEPQSPFSNVTVTREKTQAQHKQHVNQIFSLDDEDDDIFNYNTTAMSVDQQAARIERMADVHKK